MARKSEIGGSDSQAGSGATGALVKELEDAFQFFDLNGDGKLSVQEMTKVVRSLSEEQVAEDDLVTLIHGVDGDGDGYLNLQEFIDLNTRSPRAENDALVAAFNKFDEDRDGFISAEELHHVLMGFGAETYSLEECRAMVSAVDANGNHLMSLKEFEALMVNDAPSQELHATTTAAGAPPQV